jgi:hypothetical protein
MRGNHPEVKVTRSGGRVTKVNGKYPPKNSRSVTKHEAILSIRWAKQTPPPNRDSCLAIIGEILPLMAGR